jgi:hypothetical protein
MKRVAQKKPSPVSPVPSKAVQRRQERLSQADAELAGALGRIHALCRYLPRDGEFEHVHHAAQAMGVLRLILRSGPMNEPDDYPMWLLAPIARLLRARHPDLAKTLAVHGREFAFDHAPENVIDFAAERAKRRG